MKRYCKILFYTMLVILFSASFSYAETEEISTAYIKEQKEQTENNNTDFSNEQENSNEELEVQNTKLPNEDGSLTVNAETNKATNYGTFGKFTYYVNQSGTITITDFNGNSSDTSITVPNTINGKSVTELTKTFAYNSYLKEITLPKSLISTMHYTFYQCINLEKINVEAGSQNFCSVDGILFSKDKTKIIYYPANKQGTSYNIPKTVKEIFEYCFNYNQNLKGVSIPNSVEKISFCVFYYSKNLEELEIPSSVTKLDTSICSNASNLKRVKCKAKAETLMLYAFEKCTSLTNVDLSESGIKQLNEFAFYKCTSLTDVKLPKELVNIKDNVFSECTSLTKLFIPNTVSFIGRDFILNSPNLKNYNIPSGLIKNDSGDYIKAGYVTISGTEKYEYVSQVLEKVNNERKNVGLPGLTLDKELTEIAMTRALEISIYFEHDRTGLESLPDKVFGENIAGGQGSPTGVMKSWMSSTGHKANILGKSYNSIGIGAFEKDGTIFWVQVFGNDKGTGSVQNTNKNVTKKKAVYYQYLSELYTNVYSSRKYKVGEKVTVIPYIVNQGWTYKITSIAPTDVTFFSSNTDIMEIDKNGNMNIKSGGKVTLTIRLSNISSKSIELNFEGENLSNKIANLIFDYKYYADTYPDLRNAFGYNENALRNHWLNCGIKEGRKSSAVYDGMYYLENNSDLKNAFGKNYELAYNHFVNNGYKELRKSSALYWGEYYKNNNTDLKNMSGYNLIEHYLVCGRKEGRIANKIQNANSSNNVAPQNITNSLFNTKLYYDLYPDLRNAFGYNESALRNHWLNCGIKEGRIGSLVFDAKYYLDKYSDLKKAFGNNYQLAYDHFKSNGIKEGRRASMYFDVKYYLNTYSDLKKAFGNTYSAALNHFANCGINEGREGSSEFKVGVYKNKYSDLRNCFGNNMFSYYEHYIMFGRKENRIAK